MRTVRSQMSFIKQDGVWIIITDEKPEQIYSASRANMSQEGSCPVLKFTVDAGVSQFKGNGSSCT